MKPSRVSETGIVRQMISVARHRPKKIDHHEHHEDEGEHDRLRQRPDRCRVISSEPSVRISSISTSPGSEAAESPADASATSSTMLDGIRARPVSGRRHARPCWPLTRSSSVAFSSVSRISATSRSKHLAAVRGSKAPPCRNCVEASDELAVGLDIEGVVADIDRTGSGR